MKQDEPDRECKLNFEDTLIPIAGVFVKYFWQIRPESNSDDSDYSCWQHSFRRSIGLLYPSRAKQSACAIAWYTNETITPERVVNWTPKERSNDNVQWLSCICSERLNKRDDNFWYSVVVLAVISISSYTVFQILYHSILKFCDHNKILLCFLKDYKWSPIKKVIISACTGMKIGNNNELLWYTLDIIRCEKVCLSFYFMVATT